MNTLRKAQLKMLDALIEIDRICKMHDIDYWLDAGTLLGAVRHKGFIPWDDDIDICMIRSDFNKFLKMCQKDLNTNKFFLQTVHTDPDYYYINIPCKLRINNTHIIESFEKKYKCYNPKSHHGLYVDIFPYDFYSNSSLKRKCQRIYSNLYKLKKLAYCKNLTPMKYVLSRVLSPLLSKKHLNFFTNYISTKMNSNLNNTLLGAGIETPFQRAYFNESEIFPLSSVEFEGHTFSAPHKSHKYLKKMFGCDYMELPPQSERIPHTNPNDIKIN